MPFCVEILKMNGKKGIRGVYITRKNIFFNVKRDTCCSVRSAAAPVAGTAVVEPRLVEHKAAAALPVVVVRMDFAEFVVVHLVGSCGGGGPLVVRQWQVQKAGVVVVRLSHFLAFFRRLFSAECGLLLQLKYRVIIVY